jgi:hypothetical protein
MRSAADEPDLKAREELRGTSDRMRSSNRTIISKEGQSIAWVEHVNQMKHLYGLYSLVQTSLYEAEEPTDRPGEVTVRLWSEEVQKRLLE